MAVKRHRRLFFAAAGLALVAPGLRAATGNEFQVGVRSTVTAKPVDAPDALPDAAERARVYGILAVQLIKSQDALAKPVDAERLMALVQGGLEAHGFQPVTKGRKPGILLTVQYGRGWLSNPYLTDASGIQAEIPTGQFLVGTGVAMQGTGGQTIAGLTTQLMDEKITGREARAQLASFEKLFLRVVAWEYPTDARAKARMLWQSTMVTDDPEHRDLNAVAGSMISAGAPYFGRATPTPEVDVQSPLPTGQVNVGTPKTVETPSATSAQRSSREPVAAPVADEPVRTFDIPEGDAVLTLKVFSQQSGKEIIYPAEELRILRTHAVKGEFSARAALARMVDGTGLVTVQDERTGAFAVRRVQDQ